MQGLPMRFFDAAAVDAALSYPALVDALGETFKNGAISPPRHHHHVHLDGQPDATLLLMPAWQAKAPGSQAAGRYMGLKAVSVFPGNMDKKLPVIYGTYILLSAETGAPLAVMDATRLTAWRTGAASALAARFLARPDASSMTMIGAGALAPMLIRAHASVRPIKRVSLWNRTRARAEEVVASLADTGLSIAIVDDLEAAVRSADIVSAATLATQPLIRGAWLKPGAHVDCVGAFRPDMRETDDETLQLSKVFVDTRAGAFGEAGDILLAIKSGAITDKAVLGDLYDLTRGAIAGRRSDDEVTMFKSVGASIEDLCAALCVYEKP